MHPNEELIHKFYQAFQRRDAEAMAACYHPDVHFSDSAFPSLRGLHARAMWKMLTERAQNFRLEYGDVRADDQRGSAHWDAYYTFALTGRSVHNSVDATFEFKDGLIVRHQDHFDFSRWAGQALGMAGKLMGRTAYLRNKVQGQAMASLSDFIKGLK